MLSLFFTLFHLGLNGRIGQRVLDSKDGSQVLTQSVQVASDNAPECRYYGRKAVALLMT